MNKHKYLIILFALFVTVPVARAERKYVFGAGIDVMGGASNHVGEGGYNLSVYQKGLVGFYSVYPSLTLQSTGQHSTFNLDYTFVGERYQTSPTITTTSHVFSTGVTSQLGSRTRLTLSDAFHSVPNLSLVNVLKDVTPIPGGFEYAYEPLLNVRSVISNTVRGDLEFDLNTKSFLKFSLSNAYRHYEYTDTPQAYLTDQFRTEGDVAWSHRRTLHQTVSIGYRILEVDFQGGSGVRTHAAVLGLSQEVSPTLSVELEAGPSYTGGYASQSDYASYVAHASLSKTLRTHRASIYYEHHAGDSTGLDRISDSHQGGMNLAIALSRNTVVHLDGSAFTQKVHGSSGYDYWGVRGSIALSQSLGEHWVASIGAAYMRSEASLADSYHPEYKRLFVSVGYRLPEMWRVSK